MLALQPRHEEMKRKGKQPNRSYSCQSTIMGPDEDHESRLLSAFEKVMLQPTYSMDDTSIETPKNTLSHLQTLPEQSAVQSPFMRRAKNVVSSSDDDVDEDEEIQGDGSHFWENATESILATSTIGATNSASTDGELFGRGSDDAQLEMLAESEAFRMRRREVQIREILEREMIADNAQKRHDEHAWPRDEEQRRTREKEDFSEEEQEEAPEVEETYVTCEICSESIAESALESHSIECLACSQVMLKLTACNANLAKLVQPLEKRFYELTMPKEVAQEVRAPASEQPRAALRTQSVEDLDELDTWTLSHLTFYPVHTILRTANRIAATQGTVDDSFLMECESQEASVESALQELEAAQDVSPELICRVKQILSLLNRRSRLVTSGLSALKALGGDTQPAAVPVGRRKSITEKSIPTIRDFEIIRPISRGAFGEVLLAKKRNSDELVAIKVVPKGSAKERKKLTEEQRILARVSNDVVVSLHYSFEGEKDAFFIMDYVPGGDTLTLLSQVGAFSFEMAKAYIAELFLAIDYIHSIGIIHRDLKPDNLLITADGHIKLVDFGLSESEGNEDAPLKFDKSVGVNGKMQVVLKGTPDYIAPEILRGEKATQAVDYYAAGIILYEYLTGAPPFNDETEQKVLANVLNGVVQWPESEDDMPSDARDLIEKLLDPNPATRLGSKCGIEEIKSHHYFNDVDWATIRKEQGVWLPQLSAPDDTSYFDSRGANIPAGVTNEMNTKDNKKRVSVKGRVLARARHGASQSNLFAFKNLSLLHAKNEATIKRRGSVFEREEQNHY